MAELRRFSDSLPMLLLRARETAMARFRPILHAHGITEQQWRVLRALHEMESPTPTSLAAECSILPPSMTRILRRLTDEGWVTVSRSETDQRERRVKISAKGRRLVATIGPKIEVEYAWLHKRMHPDRLAALYAVLGELIAVGNGDAQNT